MRGMSTYSCSKSVQLKGSEVCFFTTVPHARHEDTLFCSPSSLQRNTCRDPAIQIWMEQFHFEELLEELNCDDCSESLAEDLTLLWCSYSCLGGLM